MSRTEIGRVRAIPPWFFRPRRRMAAHRAFDRLSARDPGTAGAVREERPGGEPGGGGLVAGGGGVREDRRRAAGGRGARRWRWSFTRWSGSSSPGAAGPAAVRGGRGGGSGDGGVGAAGADDARGVGDLLADAGHGGDGRMSGGVRGGGGLDGCGGSKSPRLERSLSGGNSAILDPGRTLNRLDG